MIALFKKSYPYSELCRKYIITNFFIGCFITFFLIVFQPFGISNWETEHKLLKLFGFGFVSFICPVIFKTGYDVLWKDPRREETWTIGKEVIALLTVIAFIAFGNLCYSNFISISHFRAENFLYAFLATGLIGIFPIAASVTLKYNRYLALNQEEANVMEKAILNHYEKPVVMKEVENNSEKLVFIAENEKDRMEVLPENLLFIESTDNYCSICYIDNGKIKKELIRSSLKRLEMQIKKQNVVRCHRAFIVNLKNMAHIEGNAQGYRISFKETNETIPVSRNFGNSILEHLKQI